MTLSRRFAVIVLILVVAVSLQARKKKPIDRVLDWNLGTLVEGKYYPTTITAQNMCRSTQTFTITINGMPWMTLQNSSTMVVPAGQTKVVKVRVDTHELKPGPHTGTVVVRCVSCKVPSCLQGKDTFNVTMVIAEPEKPETLTTDTGETPQEVISGLEDSWNGGSFTPRTEVGKKATRDCEEWRIKWVKAVKKAKAKKPDCEELRKKMQRALREAKQAEDDAKEAEKAAEEAKKTRNDAQEEFDKRQKDHDDFIRGILDGVDGISMDDPFPEDPERVLGGGLNLYGITMPTGGIYYRDEHGLSNLSDRLKKWKKDLQDYEKWLKEKRDALESAKTAFNEADEEAKDKRETADNKRDAAEKATREYLECIKALGESVTEANGFKEKAEECVKIARAKDIEQIEYLKRQAEKKLRLAREKRKQEREEKREEEKRRREEAALERKRKHEAEVAKRKAEKEKETIASMPDPEPVLYEPQELNGGMRQVREALYSHVKWEAMDNYDPTNCHYRCYKAIQSLMGEDFSDMIKELGIDVILASMNAIPTESLASKFIEKGAEAILGLAKGDSLGKVLTDKTAGIIMGSLLPKVYGDWLGSQENTFATGPALNSVRDAMDNGDIDVWEVDKTVQAYMQGQGRMIDCRIHMRILYSHITGYVIAIATCHCPRCRSTTMIFKYRSNEDGQPIGDIKLILTK